MGTGSNFLPFSFIFSGFLYIDIVLKEFPSFYLLFVFFNFPWVGERVIDLLHCSYDFIFIFGIGGRVYYIVLKDEGFSLNILFF